MDTSARDCLVLFDTSVQGRLDAGWQAGVLRQRTRTITAGPMVDVECYPIWDTRTAAAARREASSEAHRRAQRRLDEKNARKRLVRLVNANFDRGDVILTCEYPPGSAPQDEDAAARDIRNYMRRVKGLRRRRGLPELRYLYVTERTQSARYGVRYHHHAILSGDGVTREELEALWTRRHGGYCNTRRAQPQEKHLAGFACYLTADKRERTPDRDGKNPQERATRRRWNGSRNLKKPQERVADRKISVRKAGRIAVAATENAREIFARLYPDCELIEIEAKRSAWAAGVYVYAQLRKKAPPRHARTGPSERTRHDDNT